MVMWTGLLDVGQGDTLCSKLCQWIYRGPWLPKHMKEEWLREKKLIQRTCERKWMDQTVSQKWQRKWLVTPSPDSQVYSGFWLLFQEREVGQEWSLLQTIHPRKHSFMDKWRKAGTSGYIEKTEAKQCNLELQKLSFILEIWTEQGTAENKDQPDMNSVLVKVMVWQSKNNSLES